MARTPGMGSRTSGIRENEPEKTGIMEGYEASKFDSARDVVCGLGVGPDEAIASREYRGQTYFFCCKGCAEAFDASPEAFIGEEPMRAYAVEDKRVLGPDPARLRQMEAEQQRYGSQIEAAEQRARSARENMARLRRELDEAMAALRRRREEMQSLSARESELSAMPEDTRVNELERQVAEERRELEAAERALAEARRGEQGFLLRQRAETGDLTERARMLEVEIRNEEARASDLELRLAEIDKLRGEWEQIRVRLAERRDEMESVARQEADLRARAAGPNLAQQRREMSAEESAIEETQRQLAEAERRERELGKTPEAMRATDYGQRISQARGDLEQAQKQLEEARSRVAIIQAVSPADIAILERRRQGLEADILALEARARDLSVRIENYDRMRGDLENARTGLARHREELARLGKRDEEIRVALRGEEERISALERQVAKERDELDSAQRALAEARMRSEELLRRRRAEIAELRARMREARETPGQEQRVRDLEARINQLEREADDAERRAAELRDTERRAREELERTRRERREVVMEGLPAVEGEDPTEFYRAERVTRGHHRGEGQSR